MHAAKIAREEAITEALRAVNDAIGEEQPSAQAFRIIEAIKRLMSDKPVVVASLNRVDYLERVQTAARAEWQTKREAFAAAHGEREEPVGPKYDATAGIDTPLGRLKVVTWRRPWKGTARDHRVSWASEYYLNDEPITIAEIKRAGLAQRPTTRNRQKAAGIISLQDALNQSLKPRKKPR